MRGKFDMLHQSGMIDEHSHPLLYSLSSGFSIMKNDWCFTAVPPVYSHHNALICFARS